MNEFEVVMSGVKMIVKEEICEGIKKKRVIYARERKSKPEWGRRRRRESSAAETSMILRRLFASI